MTRQRFLGLIQKFPTAIIVLLILPYLCLKAWNGGDFNTYLAAAQNLSQGISCYHSWLSYGNSQVPLQYGYSPLFATLLIPATKLPVGLPPLFFLIADVFMLVRVLKMLMELLSVRENEMKWKWLALVLLFSLRFILHNLEMVQLNILLLWLSLEGLYQIFFRNRILSGSLLLALGINFKLLPLVFLPYLLYRRQWAAFGAVLLLSGIFLLLPALMWGWNMNIQLHREWWSIINPLNPQYNAGQNADSYRIHGLSALFAAYFSKNTANYFQVLIAEVNPTTLQWMINGARLLLIGLALFFLRLPPFTNANSPKQFVAETAYLLLITPLIFPQQNKWAFVYLLPAFGFVFYSLLHNGKWAKRIAELILLLIVFLLTTLTTDGIVGKEINYYTECLKLVTIGTIILLPVLMFAFKTENK